MCGVRAKSRVMWRAHGMHGCPGDLEMPCTAVRPVSLACGTVLCSCTGVLRPLCVHAFCSSALVLRARARLPQALLLNMVQGKLEDHGLRETSRLRSCMRVRAARAGPSRFWALDHRPHCPRGFSRIPYVQAEKPGSSQPPQQHLVKKRSGRIVTRCGSGLTRYVLTSV